MKAFNPRIVCADGFEMSIQGSDFNYCTPRCDSPGKPYTHVECGYPSSVPLTTELKKYAEKSVDYRETVYPYTPVEAVEAELFWHGGIVEGEMPS